MKKLIAALFLMPSFALAQTITPAPAKNSYEILTESSGAWSVTLASNPSALLVNHVISGSGATSATITMPATSFDGQEHCISQPSATISTVTISANTGQSIGGVLVTNLQSPSQGAGNGRVCWVYEGSISTWLRIQ